MDTSNSSRGIFIGVGANIAPEKNIPAAARLLQERVRIIAVSNLYKSPPQGPAGQPPFVNGVWVVETVLVPRTLKFNVLRQVETALGRIRTDDKYAPRPIDLDLIIYKNEVIHSPDLVLPDPDVYRYPHLAVPLAEVAPRLILSDTQTPVSTLESAQNHAGLTLLPSMTAQLKGIVENG
jgi:2-amino-4-hydroxy-6-hydroxymethyldihydropteridine diphosphokinase